MVSNDLLALLRCPDDHSELRLAPAEQLAQLNRLIAAGKLLGRNGQVVSEAIDAALVRADGRLAYPVIDGIPVMLVDQAIELSQLRASGGASS